MPVAQPDFVAPLLIIFCNNIPGSKGGRGSKVSNGCEKCGAGSESKEELLQAVENLARAPRESQRLKDKPFHEVVCDLNAYRWYCDKAASHMATAEKDAPGTVKLMRKCNPLLGRTDTGHNR